MELRYFHKTGEGVLSPKVTMFYEYHSPQSKGLVFIQNRILAEVRVGYDKPDSDGRVRLPDSKLCSANIPVGGFRTCTRKELSGLNLGDVIEVNNREEVEPARMAHASDYLKQLSRLKDEIKALWDKAQRKDFVGEISYKFVNSCVFRTEGKIEHTKFTGGILYPQILIGYPVEKLVEEGMETDLTGKEAVTRGAIKIWDVKLDKYGGMYALSPKDKVTLEGRFRKGNFRRASFNSEPELTLGIEEHIEQFVHLLKPLEREMGKAFNEFTRKNPNLFKE